MALYKTKFNPFTKKLQFIPSDTIISFKDAVDTSANLPTVGNNVNDARITSDTGHLWVWDGTSWIDQGDIIDLEWSAINGKPASTPLNIDDAVSKRHTQNTDTYLSTQITNNIYVDGKRTDSYTEDGSLTKPFKTIQDAIDSITGASYPNYFNINIAPGIYTEQVTLKSYVNLTTEILDSVIIQSSVGDVVTCSSYSDIQNISIQYIGSDSSKVGLRVNNGGVLVAREVSIYSNYTGIVFEAGAIGIFYGGGTLTGTADSFIVKNSAYCWFSNSTLSGWGSPYYDLTIEAGGWVDVMTLQLYNERINNLGTLNLLTPSSRINNDSSVVGTSVKDALNTLNTNKATLSDVKADSDIADTISKKHTQNTDTILDEGGSSEITSNEIIQNLANMVFLAIQRAKDNSLSFYRILQGIVDGYMDETGIDTVNSVNEVYNAGGDFYTNNSASYGSDITTSGQAISSSDLGGYPKGNAFDKNTGTLWACNDYYLIGIAENAYIGQDFGTSRGIRRFTIRQDDASNRVKDAYWEYSDNGSDWTTLQTILNIPNSTGSHTYDTNDGGSHRYWRIRAKTMYIPATTSWNVHEIEMMEGSGANNMTLISEDFLLNNIPSEIRLFLDIEEVSTLTINTDIKISVSRDGGTTWAEGTILDIGEYDINKHVYMIRVDISSQPSNSIFKYKIDTFNNKEVKVYGMYGSTK